MRFTTRLMFGAVVLVFPAIAVVDAALAAEPAATQPTATQPAATAQTIAQWINELGSDSYTVREGASDELVQAGRAAIDATVAATQKDDLEVTTRAVQILSAMLKSRDIETADAAAAALGKVAAVRNASTAAMAAAGIATDSLADYDQVRQERTLAEIKRLGGSVSTGIGMTGNPDGVQVMLESGWHGGSAGFKLLKHVPSLERLAVHSVAMTDADLSLLDGLPRLASLEIFGTKVSLAASQKFAQAHPGVRVDRRRSNAKLGIMGENGSCKIALVQPGSAAEQAGLLPEDVILKFQGRAVNDFATLTAEIGSCEAGDKVTVEVSRDGETLKKVVTLGAW